MGALRHLSRAHVEAQLTPHILMSDTRTTKEPGPHIVQGITVAHAKFYLKGQVYQDQKKFCKQMEDLGFYMDWSDRTNCWIVHTDSRFAHQHYIHKYV